MLLTQQVAADLKLVAFRGELGIGPGDCGGEVEPRGLQLDLIGAQIAQSSPVFGLTSTPQIERHEEFKRRAALRAGGARIGRRDHVVAAEMLIRGGDAGIEPRQTFRSGEAGDGRGFAHAGCGESRRWAAVQPLADELVQLFVAIAGPPVQRRPGHAGGDRGGGFMDAQLVRILERRLGGDAGSIGAGGQQHRNAGRGDERSSHVYSLSSGIPAGG